MDTIAVAGAAVLAKLGQTQQAVSMSIMKQAANQQQMMANVLEQNAKQAPQSAAERGFGFSIFA